MHRSHDESVAERLHGVCKDVPGHRLHEILGDLRPVGFESRPLPQVDSLIGHAFGAETVQTDPGLDIGKPPAGRQVDEQHPALVVETEAVVVNPEQAKTIRLIFGDFIAGLSCHAIAEKLTGMGIMTPRGKDKWSQTTVKSILKNEKYKGDALLQKYYTPDFLTKKQVHNNGEVPQYYVEGNHEAIIEPAIFDRVQDILRERSRKKGYSGVTIFSSKIQCGCCGAWYGTKVWHSNDKYRRVIWQCNHKYDGKKCSTPHVDDKTIEAAFFRSVNELIAEKATVMADYEEIKEMLFSTDSLESEEKELRQEMEVVSGMIRDAINENSRVALDQTDFQRHYESLVKRFDDTKASYDAVCAEMDDKRIRQATVEQFLADLAKHDTVMTEFEPEAWHSLVDYVTVYDTKDIRFTFKNGKEI